MASVGKKITLLLLTLLLFCSFFPSPVFATVTYSYDANGNLITSGLNCYTYNDANQVSQVKNCNSNQLIAEYTYDHQGNRIVKKEYENGTLKRTIYSPDEQYETKKLANGTTENTTYYYVNNELVARKNSDNTKVFYHHDHLGSTSVTTDSSGVLVEETNYDPYGEISSGGTQSKYLYTGQEKDQETGLNYYGARYYDSHIRRFTQPDTMLPDPYDPQQLNRYAYARNNPLKYTDPSGNFIFIPPAIYLGTIAFSGYASAVINSPDFQYDLADWYDSISSIKSDPKNMTNYLPLIASGITTALPVVSGGGHSVKALMKNGENVVPKIWERGKYGETILEQSYDAGQKTLKNIPGVKGSRRLDAYEESIIPEIAHEAKTGYQSLTKTIQEQIAKDKAILSDPSNPIKEIIWHFFESSTTKKSGYSKQLEKALRYPGFRILLEGVEK